MPLSHELATAGHQRQSPLIAGSCPITAFGRTVSKHHGNEKIIFISATKWMVAQLSGIIEAQLRHSCVGVTRLVGQKHYGSVAEHCKCTTTMFQLSPNSGAINGDCNGEMVTVRDNDATNNDYIMTTLWQHFCRNWNIFFIFVWKKMKLIDHVTSEHGVKDHGSTHISSFSVLQSVIIMDPIRSLQLVRALIQLDD